MPVLLHDSVTGEAFRFWTRAEWGARAPKGINRLTSTREGIFYHHTVTQAGPNVPSVLRGVQAYHMDHNGWLDIAYSFAVGLAGEYDGDLFELRGYFVQGGHTENMNSHSHAIAFVGNTNDNPGRGEPPYSPISAKAKRAALAMARAIERHHGGNRVRCHGDVAGTACPGSTARAWVHAGRPTDVVAPTPLLQDPPEEEEEEMLTVYWSRVNSNWVRDTAKLDNTISHGFAVEGRFATYIGEKARPGHEGWDPRTEAVWGILDLQGAGKGWDHQDRTADDVSDDVFRGLCFLPETLARASG